MIHKVVLVSGLVGVLSGCTLFGDMVTPSQDGYFQPKPVASQDPYWQRFYELEQEIANLKAQMGKSADQATSSTAPQSGQSAIQPLADDFLARLRSKADRAIQIIDRAIAALDTTGNPQVADAGGYDPMESASDYGVATINTQIAVAGRVQRSEAGDVVGQTADTQVRQARYNYSLVYVYPEPKPWNEMWDKLEAVNEQDKWRGSNPEKPSYFIYVGAYLKESDAVTRHDSLASLLGEGPELRVNARTSALASN